MKLAKFERIKELEEQLEAARALLARVEPELVPNHDTANELRAKFGLGGSPDIVTDIRTFLDSSPAISPKIASYEADSDGRMYARYDNGEVLPTGKILAPFAGESDISPERYAEFIPAPGRFASEAEIVQAERDLDSDPAKSPFPPPPDLTVGAVDYLTQREDGSWESNTDKEPS